MEQHFVAFIDILGFSHMVESDCRDPSQAFKNLTKLKKVLSNVIPSDAGAIKFFQFSDSIVVSAPYDADRFGDFICICSKLQGGLFKEGILCRGGIAHGRHYLDQNFVFSEGLIQAYYLETRTARVPRIVVSRDLIELIKYTRKEAPLSDLISESDGEAFVDYIGPVDAEIVRDVINELMRGQAIRDASIREKILWLIELCLYLDKLPDEFRRDRFEPPTNGEQEGII